MENKTGKVAYLGATEPKSDIDTLKSHGLASSTYQGLVEHMCYCGATFTNKYSFKSHIADNE